MNMALRNHRPLKQMASPFDALEAELDRWAGQAPRGWMPASEIRETENEYVIEVDIPGVHKEDLDISAENRTLTITGERKDANQDDRKGWVRSERRYGKFSRSFRLAEGIDASKVTAEYRDGILKVHVPKPEEAKPKKINVNYS